MKMKLVASILLLTPLTGCNSTQPTHSTKSTVIKSNSPSDIASTPVVKKSPVEKITEQETIIEAINIIDSFKSANSKKLFTKEYTYKAGEDDSKNSARQNALVQLKTLLVEEIGTYIESALNIQPSVKSGHTLNEVKKEIRTISAGITQTKILEEKWDGYAFYIKASVAIDPNSVTQGISEALKSRANEQEIAELRLILKDKSDDFNIQSNQLKDVQIKLAQSALTENAAKRELAQLKLKLADADRRLRAFNAEAEQNRSKFEQIMSTINRASNAARQYVRYGMTKDEVIQVAGKPRTGSKYSDEWNYGTAWVRFEGGVVGCVLSRRPQYLCSAYRDNYRNYLIR